MPEKKDTQKSGPEAVTLDFSGVKPFEPLDERREDGSIQVYLCQVTNVVFGQGPSGPKASVELSVLQPEKYEKHKLFREYSLLGQALPFLYEYLQASVPGIQLGENFRFTPAEYLGTKVAVTVENEMFDEQVRSRVKKVYPVSKFQE